MTTRLRHLAQVNPPAPSFDRLANDADVTFMPLETVWADPRRDTSRIASKADVGTGYVRFQNGDVLVPKTAPTFQHGRSTVVSALKNGAGAGSSELHVLRARPHADARFLSYITRSGPFIAEGVTAYQGVAGLQRVTADFVADWPVIDVSLEAQRRIADFLDDQVARLDTAQALSARREQLWRERVRGSFSKQLHLATGMRSEDLDAGNSGAWMPLSKVLLQLTNGFVGPTRDILVPAGVRYLQSLHLKRGIIDFDRRPYFVEADWLAARPRIRLREGDVLIVQTGALGETAIVTDEFAGSSCHALLIARTDRKLMSPHFLLAMLQSDWGRLVLQREETGALHPHLGAGKVRDIVVPVPRIDEQNRIVAALDEVKRDGDALATLAARQMALLHEQKQALITAAVAGQFDVSTARSVA